MPHVIVGTAGHIDHGKTALVKALTGIDTDRLKEEKERGITIDIGFAHLKLDATSTVGFVDVPGHERFIKNMLAGIGGIDLVMLVIAADESVMPQTREHLDICSLLHIKQGFTVLTKTDKVQPDTMGVVELEVREFLKGSFLEQAPILRVSSTTGEGIPQLIDTLRAAVSKIEAKDDTQIFRLPIDRCFTMKGFGTVVTGTLIAGQVRKEEVVELFPSQRSLRVRGVQVHGRAANEAKAGQRTALNLQGVDVSEIERGMVLTVPSLFIPTRMFDCHLELLRSAKAIESRKRVRFHVGTVELMGYVVLLGQDRLQPGESAFVQIHLEGPAFALPGDRFIIRQYSPMVTIGGGQILDAMPEKHRRMDPKALEKLRVFKDGTDDDRIMAVVDEAGLAAIELSGIVSRLGLKPARARERLGELSSAGRIYALSENPYFVVSAPVFNHAGDAVVAALKSFHETNPLAQGIGREELKARSVRGASNLAFQALLDRLSAEQRIAAAQDVIYQYGRKVTLRPEEQSLRLRLSERFRELGLQVPTLDEMIDGLKIDRDMTRKIVQLMLKDKELVKINETMLVDRAVLEKLIEQIRALKAKNPKFGISEFKNLTGVTRKHAIPLLEYLDRQRVTRRVGDERMIL
jgi:selenocysteine-specific elongation factor